MSSAEPKDLVKLKDEAFRIVWKDGHASTYPFRYLRLNCCCAHCKDEATGEPLLDPASVPEDLKGTSAGLVGRYALQFSFSDGHNTGIYPFTFLRALCPCGLCKTPA